MEPPPEPLPWGAAGDFYMGEPVSWSSQWLPLASGPTPRNKDLLVTSQASWEVSVCSPVCSPARACCPDKGPRLRGWHWALARSWDSSLILDLLMEE